MDFDALIGLVAIFGFSVSIVLTAFLLTAFNAGDQLCQGQVECQQAFSKGMTMLGWLDKTVMLMYVSLIIGSISAAMQVDSHPKYFVIAIMACAMVWIAAPILANIFFSFVNNQQLNPVAWQFQGSIAFWNNALLIATVCTAILSFVTHGKPQNQGFTWSG